jgi:hypothetical protein
MFGNTLAIGTSMDKVSKAVNRGSKVEGKRVDAGHS